MNAHDVLAIRTLFNDRVIENEPLYRHTTFRVGGPARLLVEPKTIDEFITLMSYIKKHHLKHFVIGRGSNLLISDQPFDGVVIKIGRQFDQVRVNGNIVLVQAGKNLISLAYEMAKIGLSGLEFASGIPGTIGGAIFMNAGAYKRSISEVLTKVIFLDEHLNIRTLPADALIFRYRQSIFQRHRDWIILGAEITLTPENPKVIKQLIDERKERRILSQPWNQPSAGSVFRNSSTDVLAWQYIEKLGLRGYQLGGAQISHKHTNFIINTGYASAKDIFDLIAYVRNKVFEAYQIKFETEIELVNWE